ncbi:peptide ABC transporter substrate-binding protein [Spelaeicoccus albus]|uniref:Oligopeptide transport system substrate-binding protein n=1 Tax=Spelaeicoccus albus TaxID=1280376 RepID=A0A7Z0A9B0_9MICO|nr:ABC transporter substrate-binding protein [Spelaeicoccus albus]NYI66787.1 oligopeptide transport system substrate-binding protein [Spelaeicoccus albus]
MTSRRHKTLLAGAAITASLSLALSGCGSGSGSDSAEGNNIISVNNGEPQNPLIPTSTNEVNGGKVIDALFAGLVSYEPDGSTKNEVAKSIKSKDSKTFHITLKKGWKFTNGEKVTAHSFVDAWNYGALASNAQLAANFFSPIKGYEDVNPSGKGKKPTAKKMSGLKVQDDYHFTVTLSSPQSDFPMRLGYSAFFPLPQKAYKDMKAFGNHPIGDGPYKLDGKDAWQHNKQISVVKNDQYDGNREPKNEGIDFRIYTNIDAAYADVQDGALDLVDMIPESALKTFKDNSSTKAYSKPGSVFQSFTIPGRLKHFSGKEGRLRRQAISMAINRKQITKAIFQGTRTPATDFTAPPLEGYSKNLKGADVLKYQPAKAKKLWKKANQISKWTGQFKLGYNSDDPHKQWVDAVSHQLTNTLGIKASGAPVATFSQFRSEITSRKIDHPFRSGWQGDYPSIGNYLVALYSSGAADGNGSNDGDYKNKAFDQKVKEAASAKTPEQGIKDYQAAEEILLKDLPAIPLWYENVSGASTKTLKHVQFDWKNVPVYYNITKS